jgi:hypothetical protein
VKEAHAGDRWWLGRLRTQRLVHDLSGDLARIDVDEPVTLDQRLEIERAEPPSSRPSIQSMVM